MAEENKGGEAKLCVLPLTRLTVSHPTCHVMLPIPAAMSMELKSILRRAVNEIFQGRRNVSNIRGAESHEAPPWLAPSEKNFKF